MTLPKLIQEDVSRAKLSIGHAKAILSLNSDELQKVLHHLILKNDLTVRQAELEAACLVRKNKTKKSSSQKRNLEIEALAQKLQEHFGTKITIEELGQTSGKIAIHYYNLEDMDRILELCGITLE